MEPQRQVRSGSQALDQNWLEGYGGIVDWCSEAQLVDTEHIEDRVLELQLEQARLAESS